MTDAELVLLSLVAEGPQHGYQIQQAIDERGLREWTAIGFSSVYYVLNKLEHDGLLSSKLAPSERGPTRKVYQLTDAGRRILQTAIADLLSTPHDLGSDFVLGLANMHHLRPDQVRHALDAYESRLRSHVAELNRARSERTHNPKIQPLAIRAIYDYSLRLALTELEWLAEFRQAWEAEAPPAAPSPRPFPAPVIRRGTPSPAHRLQRIPKPVVNRPAEPEADNAPPPEGASAESKADDA